MRLPGLTLSRQRWLKQQRIKTIYIDPGSPWQNGFVESFHGRFRDEYLNREQLWTLTEARVVIEDFRRDYNQQRPHSRLGYASPVEYASRFCPSPSPVGLRPPCAWDGQAEKKTPVTQGLRCVASILASILVKEIGR